MTKDGDAGSRLDILSMNLDEVETFMEGLGEKPFRARQVYRWLHKRRACRFSEMSDIPKGLIEKLEGRCGIVRPTIERRQVSQLDGTVKYLLGLPDGNCVEAVCMDYRHGKSLCISTQVGCRMGCSFCASTLGGLVRGLTPSEMLGEVYCAQQDTGGGISSLVLMGIGEPLDNYDHVLRFLELLSSEEGMNMSLRHVSLSTCGLVGQIRALAKRRLGLTLSVSLHAPNDEIRRKIMPVSCKYPMEELLQACRDYFRETGRRVSFEYALIQGVNDSGDCARELAARLKGTGSHVNLIPVNPVRERDCRRGTRQAVKRFQDILLQHNINATVRRELGTDISAACGQLRRESLEGK